MDIVLGYICQLFWDQQIFCLLLNLGVLCLLVSFSQYEFHMVLEIVAVLYEDQSDLDDLHPHLKILVRFFIIFLFFFIRRTDLFHQIVDESIHLL